MAKNRLIVLLMSVTCFPLWGQAQADNHYPISARLVARALSNNGMQTADEQVTLPAQVMATEQYPTLDILSVQPLIDAAAAEPASLRSSVRLACHSPASCVPFFAIVKGLPLAASAAKTAVAPPNGKPAITMRVGARAILVMDDQRAHIQVAVVSLENGATGKWIRVASPDHKQTYWGEVVSADRLRGSF